VSNGVTDSDKYKDTTDGDSQTLKEGKTENQSLKETMGLRFGLQPFVSTFLNNNKACLSPCVPQEHCHFITLCCFCRSIETKRSEYKHILIPGT